ncbi:hypothetical protein [Cytobacillus praedii]|uniref:hypothetical protein n=1 Tax=Cytobacillus praedii TaxID=1742358 RepID=UPI002E21F86C|nr:hypothetical protein [Cytobacillus praedii]
MKKLFGLFLFLFLLIYNAPSVALGNTDIENLVFNKIETKPVQWKGMTLVKGQIGLIEIKKNITLWKREGAKLKAVKTLKQGEKYRVYSYDNQFGGQYGVGGETFVTNIPTHVSYSTPPKNLFLKVNPKIIKVNAESRDGIFYLDVGSGERGKLFLKMSASIDNPNFTANASSDKYSTCSNSGFTGGKLVLGQYKVGIRPDVFYREDENQYTAECTKIYNKLSDNWFYLMGFDLKEKTSNNGKYMVWLPSYPFYYGAQPDSVVEAILVVGGPSMQEFFTVKEPAKNVYFEKVEGIYIKSNLHIYNRSTNDKYSFIDDNYSFQVYPPEGGKQIFDFLGGNAPNVTDGYNRFLIRDTGFRSDEYIRMAAKTLVALGYPSTESKLFKDIKTVKETGNNVKDSKSAFVNRSRYTRTVYIEWKTTK